MTTHFRIGVCFLLGLVGCRPAPVPPETPPPPTVSLPTPRSSIPGLDPAAPACVFFLGTDCPISNGYAPEIRRIADEYGPRGVGFAAVYAVRGVADADAARHAADYRVPGRVIADGKLKLAREWAATCVPEVAVTDAAGRVVYQGRIDDRYPSPGGKRREHPTERNLRSALDAVLAGRPVAVPRTAAVGCRIEFE